MNQVLEQLEGRVSAVAALVKNLRTEIVRLEDELAARPAVSTPPRTAVPPDAAPPTPADASLLEELALLRAEREVVRERIRALIREIDQVAW